MNMTKEAIEGEYREQHDYKNSLIITKIKEIFNGEETYIYKGQIYYNNNFIHIGSGSSEEEVLELINNFLKCFDIVQKVQYVHNYESK